MSLLDYQASVQQPQAFAPPVPPQPPQGSSRGASPPQHHPGSGISDSEADGTTYLKVLGLPGNDGTWRFLNETVMAALVHRTYRVKTHPSNVSISSDRRLCTLRLNTEDARRVLTAAATDGGHLRLDHRDARVPALVMTVSPLEQGAAGFSQQRPKPSTQLPVGDRTAVSGSGWDQRMIRASCLDVWMRDRVRCSLCLCIPDERLVLGGNACIQRDAAFRNCLTARLNLRSGCWWSIHQRRGRTANAESASSS